MQGLVLVVGRRAEKEDARQKKEGQNLEIVFRGDSGRGGPKCSLESSLDNRLGGCPGVAWG